MTTWRWGRATLTALGLLGLSTGGALGPGPEARAATAAREGPALARALETTRISGRPTVVVVTQGSRPDQRGMTATLAEILRTHPQGRRWLVAEVTAESSPELVQQLGVRRFPAVSVYRAGRDGLELAWHRSGEMDAYVVFGWLRAVDAPAAVAAGSAADPLVLRTSHFQAPGQVQPTPPPPDRITPAAEALALEDPAVNLVGGHGYAPPAPTPQAAPQMPAAPPMAPQPMAPQPMAPQPMAPQQPVFAVPMMPAPAAVSPVVSGPPAAPVVVAPAGPPVVFTQQPTNILVGPTPPPTITFVQGPPTAPNILFAGQAPQAPAGNLFLAPVGPAAPMPAAPPLAPSPQGMPAAAAPSMPAQVPMQPMAAFPQPMMAQGTAVQPQSAIGTAAIGLLLNNPGLIDRLLGALGRLLMRRGLPRLEINPGTPATFQGPVALAPSPVAAAPVATSAVSPAFFSIPQVPVMGAAPLAAPMALPQGEPPVYASPQSAPVRKHFIHKLFHH